MKKTLSTIAVLAVTSGLLAGSVSSEDKGQAAMKEMDAVMTGMNKQMKGMKSSGDPDHDFVMMMVPHHQSAIEMAKVELKYGNDPKIRTMAQKIIDSQKKEIEEFKAWQKAH